MIFLIDTQFFIKHMIYKIKFHLKNKTILNNIEYKKKKNKETRYLTFDAINTSLAMLKHSNTISKPLIPTKCHKFPLSLTRGKKKETDEAILATPSPRFIPDQTVPFPKQSFLSPYAHTRARKKKEDVKKKESVIKFPKRPMTTTPNPLK